MAKGKGKKLKGKGQTIDQPDANRQMKKKKKNRKAKAIDAGPSVPVSLSDSPQAHSSLLPLMAATSHGQMNLETSAFGGRFPAQGVGVSHSQTPVKQFLISVHIQSQAQERMAALDNYQGSRFKPELTRRQVRELIKLFRPFAARTAAPVAPMPHLAPPQAIRPPAMEDQFQSSMRLSHSHELHLAGAPRGLVAPIVEPYPVQQMVLNTQHELYGTAAAMGHVYPTMEHQGLQASHDPYYSQIWQDQYPRYGAVQEMQHYRLPTQRQGEYDRQQDTVAGYYSAYPLPATSHHAPATSNGPALVHLLGQVPVRPELPVSNVYPAPGTSHGPPLEHPHGLVPGRPELPPWVMFTHKPATSRGQPLVHPYSSFPRKA
ncbi:hypothetical protein Acr_16g0005810 [Actinidia rufa]|uniref:DCD domain-containing protein n=1 Tax=Actinidia rufa TaxID=165716 RepID=A0A7J0FZQ6_9ERIC|nr:hypothetical protein Acr_16g0005810 [Actinidia rufa]